MEVEPNDLLLFARIVEAGSFSAAATRVNLPKSTVSRRISLLEARLGERLLHRTTRKLMVTEFGASLLEHARKVVEEAEAAGALAQHRQAAPSGRLRISLPSDFANLGMSAMIAPVHRTLSGGERGARPVAAPGRPGGGEFRHRDPHGRPAGRRLAGGAPGHDPALRPSASPCYTAVRGLPEHPDDLFSHDLLCLLSRGGGPLPWTLTRGKVRWQRDLRARLTANSPDLLARIACSGAGIAASSELFAQPFVKKGELVRVLPEWDLPPATGWAVFRGGA